MDINSFGPFNSSVWGSVSDWCMVGVTGLTAYYLYKTLQLQIDVQKVQNTLLKIEQERYRPQIMPSFQISVTKESTEEKEDRFLTHVVVDYHLIKNECYNLTVDIETISSDVIKKEFIIEKNDYIAEDAHRLLLISLSTPKNRFAHGVSFWVRLQYQDVIANKYQQTFLCILTEDGLDIRPIGPYRIL